jgi:transposase
VAWLILKSRSKRSNDERALFAALCQQSPVLRTAAVLARRFMAMVKRRRARVLDDWIVQAHSRDVPVELRRFARGLRVDLSAVSAALSLPWSNGQTEGHVNRLKLIKRQMYGRAKFDLLWARFLHAG